MSFISELYDTGFLNLRRAYCLATAKKHHGKNLCFLLRYAAAYFGDAPALSDGDESISFRQLYKKTLDCAAAIRALTNEKDNCTIILLTENTLKHIIAMYAIQNLGMRLLPVHAKLHEEEIKKMEALQAGPCFVISEKATGTNNILLDSLFNNTTTTKVFISGKNAPVIFATSGTTGTAKMVEKKAGVFYWLRAFTDLVCFTGIHKRNAVYIAAPVAHGFGHTALLFALVLGKKAVVGGGKDWCGQALIIQKEKADLVAGVPAALYQLAENIQQQNPVKLMITGGAPLTEKVFEKITERFGTNIYSMYGSTEASTSFVADHAALKNNIRALGRPLKNVAYQLQPTGKGGTELLIRSALANQNGHAGWLHTGDLVHEDEKGALIWCGRKDDMIIKAGINIYPAEIENCLLAINGIEDVYVTATDHEIKGQQIKAYIQLKVNSSLRAEKIKLMLRTKLSGIKVPDLICFTDKFDYGETGKKLNLGKHID